MIKIVFSFHPQVMFCSMKCRTAALSTYHKYECKLVDLFLSSGMSIICFLALRTVTQKPLQWFRDNREMFELSKHDKTSGETKEQKDVYESGDYRNYFNLVSHHDERKTNDMFHRAMFSVFLLRCLQSQGYFPDPPQDSLTEDQVLIGTVLCHFLEVLQFNAHEVAQFEMVTKTSQEGAKSAFIGAAVYPTLALFNHSCDPSIVRYYVEDNVVVQAIKNIFKGEEICENYGPIFFHSAKDDRQSRLEKQYWFKCACIACQENWPLMHEMTQDVLNFRFRGKVKVLRETKLLNLQMWRVRWLRSLPHKLEHASAEVDLKLCQHSTTSFAKPLKCFMCYLST